MVAELAEHVLGKPLDVQLHSQKLASFDEEMPEGSEGLLENGLAWHPGYKGHLQQFLDCLVVVQIWIQRLTICI